MRSVGSVLRFGCTLGILAIGLTSVAQAAADRKAIQQERDNRVQIAVQTRSGGDPTASPSAKGKPSSQNLSGSQWAYIRRLVSTELRSLAYQNALIAIENRLIAQQNQIIRQLSTTSNPFRVRILDNQAFTLQLSITRDLTFLEAIQPAIAAGLTALQPYASVIPGIFNAIQTNVLKNDQAISVIAARPPFTIPPATASI